MKKTILIFCSLISTSLSIFAQDSLEIRIIENPIDFSSGHAPYTLVQDASDLIMNRLEINIEVINTKGHEVSYNVTKKKKNNIASNWVEYISFNQVCFIPSSDVSYTTPGSNPLIVSDGEIEKLKFVIQPENTSISNYMLYVGSEGSNKYSDSIEIELSFLAGIDEKKNASFSIYPNPSKGIFMTKFSDQNEHFIKITDITGKLILEQTIYSNESINLTEQLNGVYFIKIDEKVTEMVVKN